jgi:GNAT superfamily N-acetyltransferase
MPFELTKALINDILFSMEDQRGNFLLDTQEGVVAGGNSEFDVWPETETEAEIEMEGERYIRLPTWDSSDGFRLMERFAASLRNPLIREELSGALNRGKGVFRAFKDILGQYPGAEKLWFTFKEREMKREILRWYNALREEWGLQRIGDEPEETGDLVLEDFRFREGTAEDEPAAAELHRLCTGEIRGPAETRTEVPAGDSPWVFPGAVSLVAETVGGEFAGYIAAAGRGPSVHIRALEIKPEYRGLGIGEALLSRLLDAAGAAQKERPIRQLSIDLPVAAEGFSRVLLRESFTPCFTRYRREWGDSEE